MRSGLLPELVNIGYVIFVEEGRIKLHYQKPGDPPEAAKQLIDEIKECKAEVLAILKKSISHHMIGVINPAGSTEVIWNNPYHQGSPEARRESLSRIMDAIWQTVFDRIANIWPQGIVLTNNIMDAAAYLRQIKVSVLTGRSNLEDFRRAAVLFEQTCHAAAPPVELGIKVGYADKDTKLYQ